MLSGPDNSPSTDSSSSWSRRRQLAWTVALVLLGLFVRRGALDVPFFSDDFMQLGMLAGLYPGEHAVWDLYAFIRDDPAELAAHIEAGSLPWWTWEQINGSMLRPFSGFTLWLDHQLWPVDARAAHLHSLAWWAAMVFAAALVFFRLFTARVAALALALLTLDHCVSTNVAWVANRCALICATFTFLAVASHLRHRVHATQPSLVTLGWLSLALLAGEYGLVAYAYVFALELYACDRTLRQRLLALWPCALPLVAYLGWHAVGHYGTYGEAIYAHPLRTPLAYLEWLSSRMPRALADLLWSLPSSPTEFHARPHTEGLGLPDLHSLGLLTDGDARDDIFVSIRIQTAEALALLALTLISWWSLAPKAETQMATVAPRPAHALASGAVLGLLPLLAAPADSRTLAICQLGAAPMLATLIWALIDRVRGGGRGRLWSPYLLALLGVHLLADPAYSAKRIEKLRWNHGPTSTSLDQLGRAGSLRGRRVIVLSTIDHTAALHGGIAMSLMGHVAPQSWRVLSMGTTGLTLQRVDDRTLVVFPTADPLLTSPVERFYRPARAPLSRGDKFQSGPMTVEVLAKERDRSGAEDPLAIKSVRVRLDGPLEEYTFLRTNPADGQLEVVSIPPAPGLLRVPPPGRKR